MDFSEIMNIIKTFLDAIVTLFKSLGLDKLFKKDDAAAADETTTEA
jgi:hypothetical protein